MLKNEKEVFKALNDKLRDANIQLQVICVGGFVLSHNGMRATMDIDGFYETNKTIHRIIREVGDMYDINPRGETWLNNAVQNLNQAPPEEICETVYSFSNLQVLMPPLDYIAGMKLISGREQDILDVAAIVKKLRLKNPQTLMKKLAEYGLEPIEPALLLDAFGEAYGMEWLEKYYLEHEEEINREMLR